MFDGKSLVPKLFIKEEKLVHIIILFKCDNAEKDEPKVKTSVIVLSLIVVVSGVVLVGYYIPRYRRTSRGKAKKQFVAKWISS